MRPHSFMPSPNLLLIPVVIAIAVALLLIVLKLAVKRWGGAKFKLNSPLLSAPEQELYRLLVQALPDHVILAQVAFSQMITVEGEDQNENFRKRLTASQKVADYVVCDKAFDVVAVVELDDSTHSAAEDEKRDEIVSEAGSKTVRWNVSRLPRPDEIRRRILGT